jgi:hypothetical protein
MWDSFIKNFGIIRTVITLMGSAVAFFVQRADDIDQQRIQAEASALASKKVFLDKQADCTLQQQPWCHASLRGLQRRLTPRMSNDFSSSIGVN